MQEIDFCPWCGEKLIDSLHDRGHEELEARGINPLDDKRRIPKEFRTSEWWMKRGL